MPDKSNILVLMTDQQKATASHLYGNTFCETPGMARLAAEGVLYEHAFTPHPLCVPTRVSFWTSQFPHSHGSRRNETLMPTGATHAFQIWKQAGYRTGIIGKNHCFVRPEDLRLFDAWCEMWHTGLPEGVATRGMDWFHPVEKIHAANELRNTMTWQNPRFGYASSDFPLEDYSTAVITGQAVRFLEKFRHEPFALWLSYPDPQGPNVVPKHYADMFPREKIQLPPWRDDEFDDHRAPERNRVLFEMLGMHHDDIDDVYGLIGSYHGLLRFIDDGIHAILDALENLGLREKTIVVFCSDHGDFMGEHRMQCKGGVFYDCLTRVPLIVSWPGHVPAGVREPSMVNLIDIVPTVLRCQGIDVPRSMHGVGLPVITDAPSRDAAFSEYGAGGPPFRMADLLKLPRPYGYHTLIDTLLWREAEGRRKMVRTRDWKFVHDPMGDLDELYDLRRDPWELENVATEPANRGVIADMQRRLADWSINTEDARPVPMPE